ncbi:hypothetical protein [Chitinophaga sp. XS-30]|uniref:hypothetical protein n=1 Tax=Chitinophaga sp. XS-30 TaxID=2604421 RepID=UPI00143D1859|nr:hypothetical protein [Chitinophaga sp. XS-30]
MDYADEGKITAGKVQVMLKEQGMEMSLHQAEAMLDFLRDIADIMIDNYLQEKTYENC